MIKAVAFDLDDTLIDTHRRLVPAAAREACEKMIAAGLKATLEQCLNRRSEWALTRSHRDIFRLIAEEFHAPNAAELGELGARAFYNPKIPRPLPLIEGADEVLNSLSGRYKLFLVTIGNPQAQRLKIEAAGLQARFDDTVILDGFKGENKRQAFQTLLARHGLEPAQLLAVGNRRSQEIRAAKFCGARTCFFKFGEYAEEKPVQPEDHADWTIENWKDFLASCRL